MQSKNLIYIVAIDDTSSTFKNSNYAQYSIASWERWCEKNGIDLIVNRTHDPRFSRPIWNKEKIYEIGKEYDKIGIVDSDTMVDRNAPNPFDLIGEDDFCGVNDLCDLNWLFSSIEQRQKFFPETQIDISKYLNAGVLFFGKKYLYLFKELLDFYLENQEEIDSLDGGGKEQTLLNFVLQKNKVKIKLLDPCWNLLSIHRKNMFVNNWQLHPEWKGQVSMKYPESLPHFMKYAHIWHFTGFPIEERTRIMSVVNDLTK